MVSSRFRLLEVFEAIIFRIDKRCPLLATAVSDALVEDEKGRVRQSFITRWADGHIHLSCSCIYF